MVTYNQYCVVTYQDGGKMTTHTRTEVWDHINKEWRPKCPNFIVCRSAQYKWNGWCVDCNVYAPLGRCKIVAAPTECCICLNKEDSHVLLPCGHTIGTECVRKMLRPTERELMTSYVGHTPSVSARRLIEDGVTPQEFGCPETNDLDDDTMDAVEKAWEASEPEAYEQYCKVLDWYEDLIDHLTEKKSKLFQTCPICRAET